MGVGGVRGGESPRDFFAPLTGFGESQGPAAASADQIATTGSVSAPRATGPVPAPDLGPEHAIEKVLAGSVGDLFANKGLMKSKNVNDFRSPAAAAAALSQPLATPPGSKPFGPATVFRPGLGNTHASPAFIFRMARYTDRLLIAYPNAKPGQDLRPKPATEIDGVPVPPELRGKIFVSGDPANRMLSWETASALFEKQLAAADDSAFLNGGDVEGAKLTVIAHSQGGLDAANTRRSLEAKGQHGTIARVVTLNSPFKGSPLSDESFGGLLARGLQCSIGGHAPDSLRKLDPDYMRGKFTARDQRLVDLAISSTVDGAGSGNVRPLMKGLALTNKVNPFAKLKGPSDGFVTADAMKFGKQVVALPRAYDHAGIAEDPAVVDDVARALSGTR